MSPSDIPTLSEAHSMREKIQLWLTFGIFALTGVGTIVVMILHPI
jgi:hypothetical protein